MSKRLKKGEITIKEVLDLSLAVYGKDVDNKRKRMIIDVTSGKVVLRNNLTYNRSTKTWEQTGRDVRLEFIIRSKPESYKKTDTVNVHKYPVTFLIHNWELGFKSPFKWRTGSYYRWQNPKRKLREAKDDKQKDAWRKENQKTADMNIKRGIQGAFIFENMFVLRAYDLLFGPMTAKPVAPKEKNPDLIPYFDKTSYFVVSQILPKLFKHEKIGKLLQKSHK